MIKCDYCHTNFKTISSLNLHLKSAKYCLDIRGISSPIKLLHKCENCYKEFNSKQKLINHQKKCDKKPEKCSYCDAEFVDKTTLSGHMFFCIPALQDQIEKHKTQLEQEKNEIKKECEIKLDKQQTYFDGILERICNKAIETPNVTINNNKYNMTQLILDKSYIENKIKDNMTLEHVRRGQIGMAELVHQSLLMDENGCPTYINTDSSRGNFISKNINGLIERDIGARKLIKKVHKPLCMQSRAVSLEDMRNCQDNTVIEAYNKIHTEIRDINSPNNHTFIKELASLTRTE